MNSTEDEAIGSAGILQQCSQESDLMLKETQRFVAYLNEAKQGENSDMKGLLDVKNWEMVSYITNTLLLMCRMSMAESIERQECISRLIKNRIVIEKIRQLENKFNKRIENQLELKEYEVEENGALKARPDLMLLDSDGSEPKSDEEEKNTNKSFKMQQQLKQSKLRPMEDMEEQLEKAKLKKLKKANKRISKSSLIRDLRSHLSDRPEEITEHGRLGAFSKPKKKKQKYEEDYFVRLQVNKKQKHLETRKRHALESASILSFGNYMPPTENGEEAGSKRRKVRHTGKPPAKYGNKFNSRKIRGKKR